MASRGERRWRVDRPRGCPHRCLRGRWRAQPSRHGWFRGRFGPHNLRLLERIGRWLFRRARYRNVRLAARAFSRSLHASRRLRRTQLAPAQLQAWPRPTSGALWRVEAYTRGLCSLASGSLPKSGRACLLLASACAPAQPRLPRHAPFNARFPQQQLGRFSSRLVRSTQHIAASAPSAVRARCCIVGARILCIKRSVT